MSTLDVDVSDVVRLVLQFLRENNLTQSMKVLQQESKVSLNTVDSLQTFASDVNSGRWDTVLPQVGALELPQRSLMDLYEQIVKEMLELREKDTAKAILRTTEPMSRMKTEDPERYLRLEHLMQRQYFDAREAYPPGVTKEKKRAEIAKDLAKQVSVVPPSRLLALLSQSLKWQQHQGLLPPGTDYDLFRGGTRAAKGKAEEEKVPKTMAGTVKFGKKNHAECARFDPLGQCLITGSVDGFVEVWDFNTCKLKKDVIYQTKDEFMMHDDSVLCVAYSRDGDLLCTGSQDGKVKVWKWQARDVTCLRRFDRAHSMGVTSCDFSRDGTQILTGSYDQVMKIHGLKSGRTIKEFRGHTSYVNHVSYTSDGDRALSASSDGTMRIWNIKTTDCLFTFRLPAANASAEPAVHTVLPMPRNVDQLVVCGRQPSVHIISDQGVLVRSFSSGKREGGNFLCCTVSPQGNWIYTVGEDHVLYCFNVKSGQLDHLLKVADREVIGLSHHPHRNLVATYSDEGILKLWK